MKIVCVVIYLLVALFQLVRAVLAKSKATKVNGLLCAAIWIIGAGLFGYTYFLESIGG